MLLTEAYSDGLFPYLCQIDIRYATITEPDFTVRVHLVGFFIATVSCGTYSMLKNYKVLQQACDIG